MVAPDYAADSTLPIFDRDRNAIEKEMNYSTMCQQRSNYYYYITLQDELYEAIPRAGAKPDG